LVQKHFSPFRIHELPSFRHRVRIRATSLPAALAQIVEEFDRAVAELEGVAGRSG